MILERFLVNEKVKYDCGCARRVRPVQKVLTSQSWLHHFS